MDLLVEFTLPRRPLSLQANRRALATYRNELKIVAGMMLIRPASGAEDVFFSIGTFTWTGNPADSDNIIKPAQDALQGIVYANDRQVRDSLGFTRRTLRLVHLAPLPELLAALGSAREFIHVAVSSASDPHFTGVVNV